MMRVPSLYLKECGEVKEVRSGLVKITGLSNCMSGELVKFGYDTLGMIIGFREDEASVLLLKEAEAIRRGDKVFSYFKEFKIPVGEAYLGRLVNALGEPCDGKAPLLEPEDYYPIFREAPSLLERVPITETFETGLKIIDIFIPLGNGQRQLIIGDRMTGKTSIVTDTILNQKGKGVVCIYCFIGKTESDLLKVVELFKEKQVFDYTIVVCAVVGSPIGQQYLAPYVATTLGEYFMYRGKKVLVAFDDMTKHAWVYRQISLLLERPPGRDAYPGDIFYIHSQMMERAACLSPQRGSGAMTFLPIVETLEGDIASYIPSNLVSMTDGQIYLSTSLFKEGFRPAVDLGLSVSRIGSKVQWQAIKELGAGLRLEYLQYKELERMSRIRARLSEDSERSLKRGEKLCELLKQDRDNPISLNEQVVLLYGYKKGFWDELSLERLRVVKKEVFDFINSHEPQLMEAINQAKELTPQIREKLDRLLEELS